MLPETGESPGLTLNTDELLAGIEAGENSSSGPRTLKELIERVSGRGILAPQPVEDSGILEPLPFPFLAIVGQREMKLALILALINPAAGGVLLIGPRGAGKTSAVRSLVDLLPEAPGSRCYYGCLPEDVEMGGIDAVCPDCAKKYALGEPLARLETVRLVELPLNARVEDVVGGIDERTEIHERQRLRRGLLAQADRNLLYIDEVNLLADSITNAILDAAAQGRFSVRRGLFSAAGYARFTLIGSMNPEEGRLRPQILDRFGMRVVVHGLPDPEERLEAYRRVHAYQVNQRAMVAQYAQETAALRSEIQSARQALPLVELPDKTARLGLRLVRGLQIDSLRAEITLFEAARAHAAADGRLQTSEQDLLAVAPMALRGRRSKFMHNFLAEQQIEYEEISSALNQEIPTSGDLHPRQSTGSKDANE